MEDYVLKGDEIICPLEQYIDLLRYKLECLKKAYEEDSSWNYGIDELEKTIAKLKTKL
jgi:hypothetical protein